MFSLLGSMSGRRGGDWAGVGRLLVKLVAAAGEGLEMAVELGLLALSSELAKGAACHIVECGIPVAVESRAMRPGGFSWVQKTRPVMQCAHWETTRALPLKCGEARQA